MIYVGIDIIDADRFEHFVGDETKMSGLFTAKEIAYFKKFASLAIHMAGTFSAKEAVVKAFKTGFTPGIMPLDIEIIRENGVPKAVLKNGAKKFFEDGCYKSIDINISHTKSIAEAICVLEK